MNKTNNKWNFQWLNSWEQVWDNQFIAQWNSHIENSSNPNIFYEPDIVKAWYHANKHKNINPRFILAKKNADQQVIFPLIRQNGTWKDAKQKLLLPVGYTYFDYHDPIFSSDFTNDTYSEFWGDFNDELTEQKNDFDRVDIPGIRENFAIPKQKFTQTDSSPFLDLTQFNSVEEFLKSRTKNFRQDIQRSMKRIDKIGKMKLNVLQNHETEPAIMNFLPVFKKLYKIRWPGFNFPSGLLEQLIKYALPAGLLHLSKLKIDDKTISWEIAFTHKLDFYCFLGAWDPDFYKYSPARTHQMLLMQDVMSKGLETFDFLRGSEEYKFRWTDKTTDLFRIRKNMPGFFPAAKQYWQSRIRKKIHKIKGK